MNKSSNHLWETLVMIASFLLLWIWFFANRSGNVSPVIHALLAASVIALVVIFLCVASSACAMRWTKLKNHQALRARYRLCQPNLAHHQTKIMNLREMVKTAGINKKEYSP